MPALLAVALGGAMGAVLRFIIHRGFTESAWGKAPDSLAGPWAIFLINVGGCLLFGLLRGWAKGMGGETWPCFILTGVLGGFTTFSTFGWDTYALVERGRMGWALANALGSVAAGVGAVWLGLLLSSSKSAS